MSRNSYIIAAGHEGSDRLDTLADASWPTTKPFLKAAGLGPGASVLDLACGNAEIVRRYATELMHNDGRILAIDRDDVAIDHASERLSAIDGAKTRKADIMKERLEDGARYDFIVLRFILSHVDDPVFLLDKAAQLLAPGGKILIEDVDFDGHVSFPPNAAFDRYVQYYKDFARYQNVDATIGRKLVDHVRETGLNPVLLKGNCPAFYDGPGKQMALVTFKLISPGLVANGLADQDVVDTEYRELESYTDDAYAVIGMPHIFQVAASLAD